MIKRQRELSFSFILNRQYIVDIFMPVRSYTLIKNCIESGALI